MKILFLLTKLHLKQARNYGRSWGAYLLKIFLLPWKNGLEIVLKIWAPLRKLRAWFEDFAVILQLSQFHNFKLKLENVKRTGELLFTLLIHTEVDMPSVSCTMRRQVFAVVLLLVVIHAVCCKSEKDIFERTVFMILGPYCIKKTVLKILTLNSSNYLRNEECVVFITDRIFF